LTESPTRGTPEENPARFAAVRLAGLALILVGIFAALKLSGAEPTPERLEEFTDRLGVFGPIIYLALGIALSCAFVPFPLIAGVAGALFGVGFGAVEALAIATGAAASQAAIARYAAPQRLSQLGPLAKRIDQFLAERGVLAAFLTRLIPGLPYVPVNYAAGLTSLRISHLAIGSGLATAPRAYAYAALGGTFGDWDRPEAKIALVILGLLALAGLVAARRAMAEHKAEVRGATARSASPRRELR
jgi:uncharacterized membrane protein YdjX (TVP38/TMEM64 family)